MTSNENEFDSTRNAMFEVRRTVAELHKASQLLHTAPEAFKIDPSGVLWSANKREMGNNFKRIMLEELTCEIDRLTAIRNRLETI